MLPEPFMRPIDRVQAERQIRLALDEEMKFDDIDIFFGRMNRARPRFEGHYTKEDLLRGYLKQCSDNLLLDIGSQLGLDVPRDEQDLLLGESNYWLIDHFRLFISHVHTSKESAANLKTMLKRYAISCFVAHEDIQPTHEWREEILRALNSMDALTAILSSDFNASKWTDQEVGFAVAKNVLIIPIFKGLQPYGFIERYQALKPGGAVASTVAEQVFQTVCKNPKTRPQMVNALVRTVSSGSDLSEASFRVQKLSEIDDGKLHSDWEKLRENIISNEALRTSEPFITQFNKVLPAEIDPIIVEEQSSFDKDLDDEIPF